MKIAVLGAGRIGAMHAELIAHRADGVSLAGVFDVAGGVAAEVGQRLGVPVFETAEAAIDSDADAVAICSSTPTHIDLVAAAAEAGKAIFCEKPLSLDLAELDRGLAAVEAAGVTLHVGFNRRFDASHAAVRAAVADGDIGQLRQLRISSRDPAPPPIAYIEQSGGIFLDMTIHDFDMARFITGSEVVEVYATGSVSVDPAIGEAGDLDTVTVLLTHEDGVVTTIDNCRQSAFGYDQRVEAFGSAGIVSSENQVAHSAVKRTDSGSTGAVVPYFFLDRYIPSYIRQWEDFASAVRSGAPPPVSGADGRAPLVVGLAAKQSVATKSPVRL
jgi:myo-inositol 2-dehydrogenase/D-chiro-inositol 1-dehydrogenase